jgi:hypothetical protein
LAARLNDGYRTRACSHIAAVADSEGMLIQRSGPAPRSYDDDQAPRSRRKFLPTNEQELLTRVQVVAREVAKDPERYLVTREESDALSAAAAAFGKAMQQQRTGGSRSEATTRVKNEARDAAKRLVTRVRDRVRISEVVDHEVLITLKIPQRQGKPRAAELPKAPPALRFVRALHEGGGATPVHELAFGAAHATSKARPAGAARLELFVDLIPPDEPIPAHPGTNYSGRPWYLRSYTRSPIRLTPPMARVPMRVVYWGRWADSSGEVGPFSATAVAWIEGGSQSHLPGAMGMTLGLGLDTQPQPQLVDATAGRALPGPDERDVTYRVAVMEVQVQSMQPSLPATPHREVRQLEGPSPDEASEAA